jgi:hypothetical protein
MFRTFGAAARRLLSRRRDEADLNDEIQFHLSEDADLAREKGLSPEQARQAAVRAFGNVSVIREDTRTTWGWRGVERVIQDVAHGLRVLRSKPIVTTVAVLSLAIGVGASTAIFAVVWDVVLKPLPTQTWTGSCRSGKRSQPATIHGTSSAPRTSSPGASDRNRSRTWA